MMIDARRGVVAWRESARSVRARALVMGFFFRVGEISVVVRGRARTLMFAIERDIHRMTKKVTHGATKRFFSVRARSERVARTRADGPQTTRDSHASRVTRRAR
jgi:hypothetical protein